MDKEIKNPEGQEVCVQEQEKPKDSEKAEQDKNPGLNFEMILDNHIAEASKDETHENSSVRQLKELLRSLDENGLLAFFDEIALRVPENIAEEKKDSGDELKLIRRLFTMHTSIFTTIYCAHLSMLYPTVMKISKALDLSQIPLFSTNPKVALYGHKEKTEGAVQVFAPLKSDQIIKILNAEIAEDKLELAEEWICEIASYSKVYLCDSQFEASSVATHEELKKRILEEPRYRALLFRYLMRNHGEQAVELFERNSSIGIMNAKLNRKLLQSQQMQTALEDQKTALQAEVSLAHSKLSAMKGQHEEIEQLRERVRKSEERYAQQVRINEELQCQHDRKMAECQEEFNRLIDDEQDMEKQCKQLRDELAQLRRENQNLQSDLASERNRNQILREDAKQVAAEAKKNITGDFVNLLSEPINHFQASFEYFKEIEEFEPSTLEICQADLEHLVNGLGSFGAKTIGVQGELVPYDRDLHYCEDHLENGEPVRIAEIGWMVNGNVILKAMTEKAEE